MDEPAAPSMTVGTVKFSQIAQIDRVIELAVFERNRRARLRLIQHRVAEVAVFPDDASCLAYVLAVVATETTLIVEVPGIIGMSLPVDFHFRENVCSEYPLDFFRRRLYGIAFPGMDFGIIGAIKLV